MTDDELNIDSIIFKFIDEFKFLFFPEQWSSAFMDYSKNDILVLLFIYRNKSANMTEISDYIKAPLNTTTGIVSRLEKKLMVERIRDVRDRRVINIVLTEKSQKFIYEEKKVFQYYFIQVYKELTDEEKDNAVNIFKKVLSILKQEKNKTIDNSNEVKKIRKITIE